MSENEYWFCLKHHTVEGEDGCPQRRPARPLRLRRGGRRAPWRRSQERNEEWDNDPKWNDDGAGSGDGLTDGTPDN